MGISREFDEECRRGTWPVATNATRRAKRPRKRPPSRTRARNPTETGNRSAQRWKPTPTLCARNRKRRRRKRQQRQQPERPEPPSSPGSLSLRNPHIAYRSFYPLYTYPTVAPLVVAVLSPAKRRPATADNLQRRP